MECIAEEEVVNYSERLVTSCRNEDCKKYPHFLSCFPVPFSLTISECYGSGDAVINLFHSYKIQVGVMATLEK